MREVIKNAINDAPDDQVDLEGQGIQDDEIAEIMQFIAKTRPNVTELFLNKNALSDTGAITLAKELSSLKKLEKCDLQFNHIGIDGLTAIYNEVKGKVKLSVHGNKVADVAKIEEIKRASCKK